MNQEELLAERYGKKPKNAKRDRIVALSIAVVALVGFLTWAIAVTAENSGRPTGNLLSYSIESDHQITVEISANDHRSKAVICQVQALADNYEVVGYKEVPVAVTDDMVNTTLNTVKPAVSAVVKDCWFK